MLPVAPMTAMLRDPELVVSDSRELESSVISKLISQNSAKDPYQFDFEARQIAKSVPEKATPLYGVSRIFKRRDYKKELKP